MYFSQCLSNLIIDMNIILSAWHGLVWTWYFLYTNIDQKLRNKLHGPMHYKIGDTCVYNRHVFYTLYSADCYWIHKCLVNVTLQYLLFKQNKSLVIYILQAHFSHDTVYRELILLLLLYHYQQSIVKYIVSTCFHCSYKTVCWCSPVC